jgi:metal-responsive CopG/Arc/MetJ family transcriptional regulator
MEKRRTHVVIPEVLVAEIDAVVGKRGRSQFLVQAATFEIKRRRQQAALKQALGAWKAEDHPELKGGVDRYVRKLRRESDDRFKRVTGRR